MPPSVTAFAQIGQIASRRAVHAALAWLHLHEQQIMRWQLECVTIPAPTFHEGPRAAWLAARFCELDLSQVHSDSEGNTLGTLGYDDGTGPLLLLSAHLDTVFPPHTAIEPRLEDSRLHAPGACDNGAGLAGLLAIAGALRHAGIVPPCPVVFLGNVGEEGEGDLRGVRHIYATAPWRDRIAAHLVLDGAGHNTAVVAALGSRRFEVSFAGPGGHSWTDAARPNPAIALADAITRMASAQPTLQNGGARTTWNIGTMEGGTTVNSIPSHALARFDLRSTDAEALLHLEVALFRAVEDATRQANQRVAATLALASQVRSIGNRPVGTLPANARILALLGAVDRHLNLRTELQTASTDANIPLSLGVEALSLGAGGDGGGTHTTGEWFDARGRDLGLRRVLLLLLALTDCHHPDSQENAFAENPV